MAKKQALGFGFIPEETKHHFLLIAPRSKSNQIVIYERFQWDEGERQTSDIDEENLKVVINKEKWDAVKGTVQREFNRRLNATNTVVGRFKSGENPIERLLGKELVLLLWAIENSDPGLISIAIKNWLGLSPEERWWLFTMTNATTGHYADSRGWRKAVRYALTENPIDDKATQGNIAELLYKQI